MVNIFSKMLDIGETVVPHSPGKCHKIKGISEYNLLFLRSLQHMYAACQSIIVSTATMVIPSVGIGARSYNIDRSSYGTADIIHTFPLIITSML